MWKSAESYVKQLTNIHMVTKILLQNYWKKKTCGQQPFCYDFLLGIFPS